MSQVVVLAIEMGHERSLIAHMTRLAAALLLALSAATPRLSAQTLTITNATVVDVSSGALHRGSTVVVEGNRIVSERRTSSPFSSRTRCGSAPRSTGSAGSGWWT